MAENSSSSKKLKDIKSQSLKREGQLADFVFGKIPPQALDVEEAVLGALMLDKDALPIVLENLNPESFYKEAHQVIYAAMRQLFEKSHPVDLLTVTDELRNAGKLEIAGGPAYLVSLTNRVASSANIEYHSRIVAQKHIQRELIRVSTNIIRDSFEDTIDVFTLLDDAEKELFHVSENNLRRQYFGMGELTAKTYKILEELKNKKDGLTGVPTGFTKLDRITSGWQSSDLIIVAARPAMGKTSFVLSLALNAALEFKRPVAFFSLEMASTQLVQRLISVQSEIDVSKLRTGKLQEYEWTQLHHTIEKLSNIPLYIDDTPGINIFELRAKCRRLKKQHKIEMVIIDYLQLMSGGPESSRSTNREQEISAISRSLKGMAKELNVPVIALSQLSRQTEIRGGSKKPQLADLRESGAIEQDADIVSFIYRPEYYDIMEDDKGNSNKGIAEIIIAKHRNGPTDTVRLRFIDKFTKFENIDEFNFDSFPSSDPFAPQMESQGVIKRSSKMNDEEEIPF
jgi:replicative DNA helicase